MSESVAKDESLRTTRSSTIFHALVRLFGTGNLPSRLVLHVLGADHREGTTPEETRSVFSELFHLLGRDGRVLDLDLLLCGPNIELRLHGTTHGFSHFHAPAEGGRDADTLPPVDRGGDHDPDSRGLHSSTAVPSPQPPPSPPPSAGRLAVKLRYDSGLYHDVSGLFPTPNALFLFNAGLWGYDDWEPTLERVLGCGDRGDDAYRPPPVVVTSYCPEEASDDMETIQRVDGGCKCLEGDRLEWLWKPEVNPYRSLVPRQTRCGVEGRGLFENHSWQAVRRSRGQVALPPVAAET
eukprot:g2331.t1